jgi:Galactose oxidase, central domain
MLSAMARATVLRAWLAASMGMVGIASCSSEPTTTPGAGVGAVDALLSGSLERWPSVKPLLRAARPLESAPGGPLRLIADSRGGLAATLPSRSDEPFVVTAGTNGEMRVRRLGALPAEARVRASAVVYPNAWEGVDAVAFAMPGRIEELLLVRSATAEIAYDLDWPEDVEVTAAGARRLELHRGGQPWLRVRVPAAWDATGRVIQAGLSLTDRRMEIAWDRTAALPVLIDPAWESAGSMLTERFDHTATLLTDGRVLLLGSRSGSKSAEVYNPLAPPEGAHFSPVVPSLWPHGGGTATMLPSGRVLLAGGLDADGDAHGHAETYDPDTESFEEVPGGMGSARAHHTATLLASGKVLIAGGAVNNWAALPSYEVFDPAGQSGLGVFTPGGFMQEARTDHTASRLVDDRVLLVGGWQPPDGEALSSTDLFDETSATMVPGPELARARSHHTATLTMSGRVLVLGGRTPVADADPTAELFYPGTGGSADSMGAGPEMTKGRAGHSASLLPSGELLVLGGGGPAELLSLMATWEPTTANVTLPVSQHTATVLPSGRVFVAGGDITEPMTPWDGKPTPATAVFDPIVNNPNFGQGEAVALGRPAFFGHTVTTLLSGRVLITGGADSSANGSAAAELYDPDTGTLTELPSMSSSRVGHTATLLSSGKVLVAGGCVDDCIWSTNDGVFLDSMEIFDPEVGTSGAFTPAGVMNSPRAAHRATLLANGRVLLTGGFSGPNSTTASSDIYDPATGSLEAGPEMNSGRLGHTATMLTLGRVLIAGGSGGNTSAELFEPTANQGSGAFIPAANMILDRRLHAASPLPDGRVLITGGVSTAKPEGVPDAEVFNPEANGGLGEFSPAGAMAYSRAGHASIALPDGRMLIAGGDGSGAAKIEICDETATVFSNNGTLDAAMHNAAGALLLDGRAVFVGGPWNADGIVETWTPRVSHGWLPLPKLLGGPVEVPLGSSLLMQAAGLRGARSGSTGRSNDSAANYPVGVWLRVDGGGRLPASMSPFTDDSATVRFRGTGQYGPGILFPVVAGATGRGVMVTVVASPDGANCVDAADCESGYCRDHLCCDTPCTGVCESCAAKLKGGGNDGVCGPTAADTDPDGECEDYGAASCYTDGQCDGATRACRVYSSSTPCGAGHMCPGDGSACLEVCQDDTQCSEGYFCDTVSHDCLVSSAAPICDGDHTIDSSEGQEDCSPYRCSMTAQVCLNACSSAAHCVTGYVCNADGRCVRPGDVSTPDEGGCSCVVPRARSGNHDAYAAALVVVFGLLRRRRRNGRLGFKDRRPPRSWGPRG